MAVDALAGTNGTQQILDDAGTGTYLGVAFTGVTTLGGLQSGGAISNAALRGQVWLTSGSRLAVGVGLVGLGLNAADEGVLWLRTLQGDCDAFGEWAALQQLGAADGLLPFGDVLAAGMLVTRRGTPADFFTLYHGTSSNRAAKIVGSDYYSPRGFRHGIDDAVYFTGGNPPFDFQSAANWAVGAANSGSQARSFTVIRFNVPDTLARDLELIDAGGALKRIPVGQYRDAPFQDLPDPYEIVLIGDHIVSFNQALLEGQIIFQRYRLQPGGRR
jgi:hypothetical protein